jgi:hypothetical protein
MYIIKIIKNLFYLNFVIKFRQYYYFCAKNKNFNKKKCRMHAYARLILELILNLSLWIIYLFKSPKKF